MLKRGGDLGVLKRILGLSVIVFILLVCYDDLPLLISIDKLRCAVTAKDSRCPATFVCDCQRQEIKMGAYVIIKLGPFLA